MLYQAQSRNIHKFHRSERQPDTLPGVCSVAGEVLIHGLVSRRELNGRLGKAVGYDVSSGRCKVTVGETGVFLLRQDNILPLHETLALGTRNLAQDLAAEGVTGDELLRHLNALEAVKVDATGDDSAIVQNGCGDSDQDVTPGGDDSGCEDIQMF